MKFEVEFVVGDTGYLYYYKGPKDGLELVAFVKEETKQNIKAKCVRAPKIEDAWLTSMKVELTELQASDIEHFQKRSHVTVWVNDGGFNNLPQANITIQQDEGGDWFPQLSLHPTTLLAIWRNAGYPLKWKIGE